MVIILTYRALFALNAAKNYSYFYNNETNTTIAVEELTLPFTKWFPKKINKTFAFIYEILAPGFYGFSIGAIDSLITGAMIHIKAQLLILKDNLNNCMQIAIKRKVCSCHVREVVVRFLLLILQQKEKDKSSNKTNKPLHPLEQIPEDLQKHVTAVMKECISHHQHIILLADEVEEEYNYLMLLQFLGTLIILCVTLFQMSVVKEFLYFLFPREYFYYFQYAPGSYEFMSAFCYLFLMLWQIFVYCWHGNEVQLESFSVACAIYACDWIGMDESTKKMLVLMMLRAQRPLKITAGKFAFLSVETFTTVTYNLLCGRS